MSWRRILLTGAALVIVVAYFLRVPLFRWTGQFLVEEEPPVQADAIVVLSGSFPDRILEAVALYEDGFAGRIILSHGPQNAGFKRLRALGVPGLREYERNREVAERLGVPREAIAVLDRPAASTFGEAQRVLQYVRRHGYRSILLVTSKYHTRRAAWIYRHLAGGSVRIIIRPARDDGFRPDAWWRDRMSFRRVITEYQKLLMFFLHDRWAATPFATP